VNLVIRNLTQTSLKEAPEWNAHPFSCKYCLYWEYPQFQLQVTSHTREELLRKKSRWLRATRRAFGNCGKILEVDRISGGYVQYAPAEFLPNVSNYPWIQPSNDAVLISCLFIPDEKLRSLGLGSLLLTTVLYELKRRRITAVETFARKEISENPSGPVEFYLRNGFRIHRDDSEYPLMRFEF